MKPIDKKEKALAFHEKLHKKKDTWECRGKKPHQFILTLPSYIKWNDEPALYYKSLVAHREILERHNCALERCPLKNNWYDMKSVYYICVKCGKKICEYDGKINYQIRNNLIVGEPSLPSQFGGKN